MGGQACVWYGAAEFSRDTDVLLLAEPDNLRRLAAALRELRADCIAVPSFRPEYLQRGHAVHFRCHHPAAAGMRLDVMSVLRNMPPFPRLWARRTSIRMKGEGTLALLSLPDLVQAKKTQRDKDWLMLDRLVAAHYLQHQERPARQQVDFWLGEARDAEVLTAVAARFPARLRQAVRRRPLLEAVGANDQAALARGLAAEERGERDADAAYWRPLITELHQLRRRRSGGTKH